MRILVLMGLIIAAILFLLLGLSVLSRDKTKRSNTMFLMMCLSDGLWCAGIAAFLYTQDLSQAAGYANLYYAAALGIAISSATFSHYWTSPKPPVSRIIGLGVIFAAYCLTVVIYPRFILEQVFISGDTKAVSFNVVGQIIYSLIFGSVFLGSISRLVRSLKNMQRVRRSQTQFIIVGLISAGTVGIIFNLIMPWFGLYGQIWVGPLFSMLFVGFVSFAIARHKLFDFRRTVARATAYLITLSTLALIYVLVLFLLTGSLFRGQNLTVGQRLFFITFSLFAAMSFQSLKHFFDKITNRFFYRDAYEPGILLDRLNSELIADIELEVLLRRTCEVIQASFKTENCLVITRETDNAPLRVFSTSRTALSQSDLEFLGSELLKYGRRLMIVDDIPSTHMRLRSVLSDNDIAVIAPVVPGTVHHKHALAYLVLGPKKSGNMYGKEDIQLIEIISDELVIAIQNALRFEEIQGFAATLQAKVNEATAELKAANRKLKEIDETKDEFISMASHQLRTPLTSVKGYLSMVLEGDAGKLTEEQRKYLNQSFLSSQRMVNLISDLLNVSRLKTGKFVIESHPSNLAEVIEGEIGQLREVATGHDLELKYDKPSDFPTLMLDETKVRQVIMNFIDNAIYYTPKGGHIEVQLANKEQTVEFTVKDNGIGVPKHEQHNLFNKFYRAGNAQKARPDGTGLGLFMAKKVIIAQGGSLIFTSQEGKGSTFGFTLPKAKLLPASQTP